MKPNREFKPASYGDYEGDEPIFVLRGSDKYAPSLVWLWAAMYELEYQDRETSERARDVFVKMLRYETENHIKVAGLAQSALAAICELIKVANFRVQNAPDDMTNEERFRLFLSQSEFEPEDTKE